MAVTCSSQILAAREHRNDSLRVGLGILVGRDKSANRQDAVTTAEVDVRFRSLLGVVRIQQRGESADALALRNIFYAPARRHLPDAE